MLLSQRDLGGSGDEEDESDDDSGEDEDKSDDDCGDDENESDDDEYDSDDSDIEKSDEWWFGIG